MKRLLRKAEPLIRRLKPRIQQLHSQLQQLRPKPPPHSDDPLDRVLFHWGPRDFFTVRDLLNGGVCVIGRAGSGKTSSSGKLIGRSIAGVPGSGGLILSAKPEDLEMWQAIFAAAGRLDDLLVFGPGQPLRFNLLGYVIAMGGSTREVTKTLMVIGETLRAADKKGGESADFWEREQERMIYNTVEVVKLSGEEISAPNIQRFITHAPQSMEQINTDDWRKSYCSKCLLTALYRDKTEIEKHDVSLAMDYWLTEFPTMGDRMRSSILTGVMGMLHVFNVGMVRELVSTSTNTSPDDMLRGKWVLVNMPPAEYGDTGSLVAAGWKYLTEKMVLRRHAHASSNTVTIWADEAAQFVNSFDSEFITQCRSHRGSLVFLTQSLHSYYSSLKGNAGKHQANALLTNFSTRIMHAIGDAQTAKWASEMVGNELECFVSTNYNPSDNVFDDLLSSRNLSASVSFSYQPAIQPKTLMHGLRTGGLANDLICDAIVIRSAEPFSSGRSWMKVAFSQKD
jgi:hypothetical protein